MEFLSSGVLQKLFREMGEKGKENQIPFLLQIRSIIPVSAEGDLWPNQGFYLKVSDSSHAMLVSLPQEQDDMVLCNKLKIGQLIYVDKLESSYPVPIIKGINPIPAGQFPCLGNPEDLVLPMDNLKGTNNNNDSDDSTMTKLCDSFSKMETNCDYKEVPRKKPPKGLRSLSASKVRSSSGRMFEKCEDFDDKNITISTTTTSSSSSSSSSSSRLVKRRSWSSRDILDANNMENVIKPSIPRSRSANTSPIHHHLTRYESSDQENLKPKTRVVKCVEKTSRNNSSNISSTKTRNILGGKISTCDEKAIDPASMFNQSNNNNYDKKMEEETKILWTNLPLLLANHGKEVLRQREAAMFAAVDFLQEASAADRTLQCLSIYSKLQLRKEDNLQEPVVDKFFDLQTNLTQTLLILHSLRKCITSDREKNAISWLIAALESDLTPCPYNSNIQAPPKITTNKNYSSVGLKPKGKKGNAVDAASRLASDLQGEGKKWFLGHVENYLDEVKSKIVCKSDYEVAEIMRQMKKVNDWLDMMMKVETDLEGFITMEDSELEAFGRVRDKIYAVFMQNVERTAMALEHTNKMN